MSLGDKPICFDYELNLRFIFLKMFVEDHAIFFVCQVLQIQKNLRHISIIFSVYFSNVCRELQT
jgi:hypothetical protein